MSLSPQDIEKIANLAQIAMTDNQREHLSNDLNNIITLVNKIDGLDVSAVEPLLHPFDATQPLRNDIVTEINQREAFQKIAPHVQLGLYIVPAVLDTH